ncbi:hypothetical protein ROHU_013894 [Labeo rohita]|uniref:Uncharacterized protein n=1 Tax=Labeo rohita TaxID=84645 RepID=A0A498P5Y3_LABRO|nr:hypothetical protein ROHU_014697 [Labeo rohita]RXN38857.1 hypothetical protein ROHU_013894 [Labeo rohita]
MLLPSRSRDRGARSNAVESYSARARTGYNGKRQLCEEKTTYTAIKTRPRTSSQQMSERTGKLGQNAVFSHKTLERKIANQLMRSPSTWKHSRLAQ